MTVQVRNDADNGRYELVIDGAVAGVAEYTIDGERVTIPHTEIDPKRRGQGLAAILVRAALEDVRSAGRSVIPQCSYVAQFVREHPEFSDLVAD